MNIDKIRSEFPYLNTDQIYFDHAAVCDNGWGFWKGF